MSTVRLGLGAAILLMGCTPIDPAQNTFPQNPEPTQVAGPPGGSMDPQYGYPQPGSQQPAQDQGYQQGYPDGYGPSTEDQAAQDTAQSAPIPEPSADPNDPGYDMGQVNDSEIDATLDGYGQWEENDDYGRVWRPDTTAVGVDFTPYETCGSWIWSDAGWDFNCDSYSWGWLPFHYGRWGWFDGYWGWQPGNTWSSAAVEWRGGGGYTGWRPLTPIIRDHRGQHNPPEFHDHRTAMAHDSQWRFTADKDFGHGHIKGTLFQNPSEGLRVTNPVQHPGLRGNYAAVSSSSLMRNRLQSTYFRNQRMPTNQPNGNIGRQPQAPMRGNEGARTQGFRQQPAYRGDTPTWRRPPQQQQPYRAPNQAYRPTYRPPAQSSWGNRGYSQPSRSYNGPAHTYAPPARSFGPSGGGNWGQGHSSSGPSHSSSGSFHSSGGGGSSHSSGGGSSHSSGGGGGHHR
jgi:hypothetical protein